MNAEERITQFKNMIESDPDNELGHFSLGKAYVDAEQFAEAQAPLRRVLELNRSYSKAYQLLGQALISSGKREEAVAILKRGYEVASERGDVMPRDGIAAMLADLNESPPAVSEPSSDSRQINGSQAKGFRCRRCGRPHGKLSELPFKGTLGEQILSSICTECWREWIPMGTKVINELGLQLSDPRAEAVYDEHMKEFLQLQE